MELLIGLLLFFINAESGPIVRNDPHCETAFCKGTVDQNPASWQ
jgi:hypothetical protein